MACLLVIINTAVQRCDVPVAVLQHVEQTALPGFAGIQADLEAQPPVGVLDFGLAMRGTNGDRTHEIAVAVAGPKLLRLLRPRRGDAAAAYDVARLYLENVRKVAAQSDLELEAYPFDAVVGDVEIFVHAAVDGSAEGETERARRDHAVRGEDPPIGEINS